MMGGPLKWISSPHQEGKELGAACGFPFSLLLFHTTKITILKEYFPKIKVFYIIAPLFSPLYLLHDGLWNNNHYIE